MFKAGPIKAFSPFTVLSIVADLFKSEETLQEMIAKKRHIR